jgi:hypothetical protein
MLPVDLDRGRKVARQADNQPQPVLGEAQRQLVERELRLLLDLPQLGENLVPSFHSLPFYAVSRARTIKPPRI